MALVVDVAERFVRHGYPSPVRVTLVGLNRVGTTTPAAEPGRSGASPVPLALAPSTSGRSSLLAPRSFLAFLASPSNPSAHRCICHTYRPRQSVSDLVWGTAVP